jgi:hypothetical protein
MIEYWVVKFTKNDNDPLHQYLFAIEKDAESFKKDMDERGYITSIARNEEFL